MANIQPAPLETEPALIQRTVYGLSIFAIRWNGPGDIKAQATSSLIWAVNIDEARGRGLREGEKEYPSADGWKVTVAALPMPREMAQEVAEVLASEKGWPAPEEEDDD